MPSPQAGRLAFGRFQLDLIRHRVTHEGEDVYLPSRAVFVLQVLAESPRLVLDKSIIAERGWPDGMASEANLMVQISKLRQVLRRDGDEDGWIRTVRGEGYVFDVDVEPVEEFANKNEDEEFGELMQKGIAAQHEFSPGGMQKARQIFEQCQDLRPGDPVATLHQTLTLFQEWYVGMISGADLREKLEGLVLRVQRASPDHALTHLLTGMKAYTMHLDFETSDAAFARALELDNYRATTHEYFAYSLLSRRRFDEANRHFNEARANSPSDLALATSFSMALYAQRRYEDAIENSNRVLEFGWDQPFAHCFRALSAGFAGLLDVARESLDAMPKQEVSFPFLLATRGMVGCMLGDVQEADDAIESMGNMRLQGASLSPVLPAVVYMMKGDHARAIEGLREGIDDPYPVIWNLALEEVWDPVRDHPEFREILRRVGLESYG